MAAELQARRLPSQVTTFQDIFNICKRDLTEDRVGETSGQLPGKFVATKILLWAVR